jgi:hypothetical protein
VITGLRFAAGQQVFRVYATWNDWAFEPTNRPAAWR